MFRPSVGGPFLFLCSERTELSGRPTVGKDRGSGGDGAVEGDTHALAQETNAG
jgi:hypothetical protein